MGLTLNELEQTVEHLFEIIQDVVKRVDTLEGDIDWDNIKVGGTD